MGLMSWTDVITWMWSIAADALSLRWADAVETRVDYSKKSKSRFSSARVIILRLVNITSNDGDGRHFKGAALLPRERYSYIIAHRPDALGRTGPVDCSLITPTRTAAAASAMHTSRPMSVGCLRFNVISHNTKNNGNRGFSFKAEGNQADF